MKPICARLLIAGLCLVTPAVANPPRIATVRVSEIYQKLESTRIEQAKLRAKSEEIGKDRRLTELRKMIEELATQRKELIASRGKDDAETLNRLTREYTLKNQEAQSLASTYNEFRQEKTKELNAEMVRDMLASIRKISATAQQLGKDEGYDWVVDTSGHTNTGLPFLLYAKNSTDLTERILQILGPAKSPPPATPPSNPSQPTPPSNP